MIPDKKLPRSERPFQTGLKQRVWETYQQTIERGFRWLLWTLLLWIVIETAIGIPFFYVRKMAALALACILGLVYLIDLRLLRRGRFKAASWSFLFVTWLVSFVVMILRGGIGSQYMVLLLATSIAAGWLLGGRSMLGFSLLTIGATLVLAIFQARGIQFPNYFSGRNPIGTWMFFGFSVATAVVPLKHILDSLRQSISALSDSEEKFRALVHSADCIVWEGDAATLRFTFVSHSAERILGYPIRQWLGEADFLCNHLHPSDCTSVMHLCGDAGQALGDFEFRSRMIAADGRIVWLHNKVHVIPETERTPRLRGIMMDISHHAQAELERKQAEEALRQNQRELLEAQRVAQVGSWHWNPRTDAVTWSAELYRIAGRDPALPAPRYEEQMNLYSPESWKRMQQCVAEALATGATYTLDLELIRPDGSTRWIMDHGEAIRDESGRVICLRGTAQDITERKRIENSLRLFRALVDHSNDAIEVLDPATLRLLDVNERACTDLGYTREDLLSMTVFDIDPCTSNADEVWANLQKPGFVIKESIHRRKDGSIYPVEVSTRLIQLDRLYAVAAVRDITRRKRTQEALRTQQQTVQTLFQLAKTLTSTLDLAAILDLLALQSLQLVGAEFGCACIREEYGFACNHVFHGGLLKKSEIVWRPGEGLAGWVGANRATYVNNSAESDPLLLAELQEQAVVRTILCAPVFDVNSEIIALLLLCNKRTGIFGAPDVESIEGIAQVASIALQNALAYRRAQQAEASLRRLSSCLIKSQDEERRRIARELHETTAQDLAAVRMCLGRINRSASRLPKVSQEALCESLEISNKLIASVRTLSYLLHPPGLEEAGLEAAFRWYASGFAKRSGITVDVHLDANMGRLPREHETTLFRIMQECLTNVHNHSGSRRAMIRLARINGHVEMEVQDYGRGITDWSNSSLSSDTRIGVGIAGMRERVQQFHGNLKVESPAGQGTLVRVVLPLTKSRSRKKNA